MGITILPGTLTQTKVWLKCQMFYDTSWYRQIPLRIPFFSVLLCTLVIPLPQYLSCPSYDFLPPVHCLPLEDRSFCCFLVGIPSAWHMICVGWKDVTYVDTETSRKVTDLSCFSTYLIQALWEHEKIFFCSPLRSFWSLNIHLVTINETVDTMFLVLTTWFSFAPCLQRHLRVTYLGVWSGSVGCIMSLRGHHSGFPWTWPVLESPPTTSTLFMQERSTPQWSIKAS